jgi:hypothetical protein
MKKYYLALVLTLFVLSIFAQNIPSYVPKEGLVGWWPFNGNTNDESGNGFNLNNTTAELETDRHGNKNNGYSLSNGGRLSYYGKSISGGESFTYSFWMKTNKNLNDYPDGIFSESGWNESGHETGIWFFFEPNTKDFGIVNPGISYAGILRKNFPYIDEWHHVVVQGPVDYKIFVDGNLFTTGVSNYKKFADSCLFHIGGFQGSVDDFSIHNRQLTLNEIQTIYKNSAPKIELPDYLPKNGLMAWYPFNGNANDESGNAHHGKVYGADLTADRFGVANKAYFFDKDSIQSTIKNLVVNNSPVTISGWFKSSVITTTSGFPDWTQPSNIMNAGIFNYGSGNNFFNTSIYSKGSLHIKSSSLFNSLQDRSYHENKWFHYSITYDGDTIKPYINGLLVSNYVKPKVKLTVLDSIFTIGNDFLGTLDDISVHNRELSNAEILALYSVTSDSVTCTPPTVSFFVEGKSVLCAGESTNLVATSNVNYMYQWYKNDTLMAGVSANFITTKESGTYHLKVSNGSCDYITPKLTILVKALPKATLDIKGKTSYCSGETINTTLTVNAGYAKYSYKWNSTQTTASINATKAMKYTVVVSDSANCTLQLSVDIKSLPLPSIGFEGPVGTVFKNDAPIKLYTSPSGGTFQGEQIVGDMYYPVNDRVGKRRIAYSVTSPEGCANTVLRAFYLVDTLNTNCTKITYDTTYVTKYDTVSVKKTVYDTVIFTNNIIKYDTVKVTKFDTITVKNNLYDTVTITNNVTKYDTVLVNKYDTLKVTKFDTITIKNNVYDTVTITNNVTKYDTVKVTKFDTVTVKNNVYDTVIVNKYDTITVTNKVTKYDTVNVTKFDTITIKNNVYDTVTITNNVTKYDTILVNKYDTITVTNNVTKYDTITLTDTVSILKITFKLTTGIQANQLASMSLYPNPTTDVLHIELGDAKALDGYRYRILDALGKEVYNELVKNTITEIPLKTLGAAGLYQMEVLDANKSSVQTNKIVLQ